MYRPSTSVFCPVLHEKNLNQNDIPNPIPDQEGYRVDCLGFGLGRRGSLDSRSQKDLFKQGGNIRHSTVKWLLRCLLGVSALQCHLVRFVGGDAWTAVQPMLLGCCQGT